MTNLRSLLLKSFYVRTALALGIGGGLLRWAFGAIVIEKLAVALLVPAGLVWMCLSVLVVESLRTSRRGISILSVGAWMIYTLACNPMFAGWLAGSREARFAETDPMGQGRFDVVIVLGGGAGLGATGRSQGNAAGDRLILAAQMYHAGLAEQLVCTGRRIAALDSTGLDPAAQSASILIGLGVPEASIELGGGRNTAEEMQGLAQKFAGADQRIGILTSAWHLARAQRLAIHQGIEAVPLPADFITDPPGPSQTLAAFIIALIPNADALGVSGRITREYLADLVGR
jgi:uncharacterized SAM-binding protein YcdF (DUF218 family)